MRTTIDIDDSLLDEIKKKAELKNLSIRAVINDALRVALKGRRIKKQVFKVEPVKLGFCQGIDEMKLNQLLDEEDL